MLRLVCFLVLSVFVAALAGCRTASGFPQRTEDLHRELEPLKQYFTDDVLSEFDKAAAEGPDSAQRYRDRVAHARLRAIDLHYAIFVREVTGGRIAFNSTSDLAVIGLSAAGAITGASSTKSILAAISGGIVGARGVIDKEVFYEKTLPAIIQAMESGRKAERIRTLQGLGNDARAYTLGQALADIENYYHAGTFVYALNRILDSTGAESKKADAEINRIYEVRFNQVARVDRNVVRDWLDSDRSSEGEAKKRAEALRRFLTENQLNPDNFDLPRWIELAAPAEIARVLEFIRAQP